MPGKEGGPAPDGASPEFIAGPLPTCVAWLAFTVVALGTARNVFRHLQSYSRPDLQRQVVRIILVGPIYALAAALCLSMDESACIFIRSVRDIWEAMVIYSFLTLVIEYMGGEHLCLHSISQREEGVQHLFPLNFCLPPIPTGSLIRVPKMGALQFVVLKPLLAGISIVVYAFGELQDWYYQWALFILYNISYSTALYALYLIYWASHDHQALQSKRPLLKFVSVKMIVFLTFWQALLLPHAPLPGSIGRWEDFILSLEMVIFSVLMNTAFSWREFHSGLRASELSSHMGKAGDIDIIGLDGKAQPAREPIGRGQMVQNAKAAFFPKDIMLDASANFSRRYQQHVLIESAQEYELHSEDRKIVDNVEDGADAKQQPAPKAKALGSLRTFRARTYLIGRSLFYGAEAPQEPEAKQPPPGPAEAGAAPAGQAQLPGPAGEGGPVPDVELGTWGGPVWPEAGPPAESPPSEEEAAQAAAAAQEAAEIAASGVEVARPAAGAGRPEGEANAAPGLESAANKASL